MNVIGLDFGGEITRISILDATGATVDEGSLRSTTADFRQRFATMPPSLIAAAYDSSNAGLLSLLSEMGHALVLSGPLPEHLRPALLPAVERFAEQGRRHDSPPQALVLRKSGGDLGLTFLVEVGQSVTAAWYFIGPLLAGTSLDRPVMADAQAASASATEQARRLHTLWTMGEISFPPYENVRAA